MVEGGHHKSLPAAYKCIFHLLNILGDIGQHKCIFFLLTMLGVLLQVKCSNSYVSPFDTDYVIVLMLIADLFAYAGTLAIVKILQASHNSDLYELMNRISLLCGTFASILLTFILVPNFGWFALACWVICFVTTMVNSYPTLKRLCTSATNATDMLHYGLRYKESRQGRLHWLEAVSLCNGEPSKESECSRQLKIDSLQNISVQCVNRADLRNGHSQGLIPDSFSLMHGRDAENGYSARVAVDKSDMVQGPLPRTCREELKADGLVLDKGFSNENSGLRPQIDLYRCLTEEETETTAASPIMRTETDFQRDVFPGLVSLSRNEVTDDLQIIEGLIRESGGSWQTKGGKGRGRKRMGTSAPSTTVADVSQPQIEQPKCEELQGPEERNLTCWGTRTRRPPRQRYPMDSCPISQN
ncbi:hypothetical protein D8674_033396 [Pyrus ussuriensis x Pyrus communis]|uniref:Uncharacterized protein n=1 Tax=Pyrus ussuriensis x Pyrus communis TaxID=2448454 RepID=A0A5N5HQV2_9ROSA|nr:hypothetical protein D8674_033396 [Pyrus ussuriensis x Pyrus communis]